MSQSPPRFVCIPLGAAGGRDEGNLSAYLIAASDSHDFICLDAGTIATGLAVAAKRGSFDDVSLPSDSPLTLEGEVLHHHVKGYFISHGYLDHVEGLVQASPTDTGKPIFAMAGVLDDLEKHLFNWKLWPNFADRGVEPCLNIYRYEELRAGIAKTVPGTPLRVTAYPLSHGPHTDSTAFLIASGDEYLLYMGDTGPDAVEQRNTTGDLWEVIVPLLRSGRLHGIFVETSYINNRPDAQLFSHLTPRWLFRALRQLAERVDAAAPQTALAGLTVVITHIKPDFSATAPPVPCVHRELHEENDLGVQLHFAEQGEKILL
ncbi:MAG: 3',5'-cyclic-nucleotide phosphodiesterase [Desulfuromonas sp.]|nr:MAG: 3',5'-cyclic-nucleotide phosphodiesterase [Desulfuromonas sp.]